jgi:Protein of unknown function (DUF3276)
MTGNQDGDQLPDTGSHDTHIPREAESYPSDNRGRYRDEVFSLRVPAGKRTYFFDVKSTKSGEDYFLTITESKRVEESRYEKHKIFLYKEDFGKFVTAMHEALSFVRDECLPEYEFRGLPDLPAPDDIAASSFAVDQ